MVGQLHKLGYQGLRVCPFMAPSGCYWRCAIVPAHLTPPTHGAMLADGVDYATVPHYSSAEEDNYFGWLRLKPKTPLKMARWFTWEFPTLAEQGHFPDPAYADWFGQMLQLTAPIGVFSAFGDGEPTTGLLATDFCDEGVILRVPPVWGGSGKIAG